MTRIVIAESRHCVLASVGGGSGVGTAVTGMPVGSLDGFDVGPGVGPGVNCKAVGPAVDGVDVGGGKIVL